MDDDIATNVEFANGQSGKLSPRAPVDHDSKAQTTIYLIDLDRVPNTLQKVIEAEDPKHTMIYCFCGPQPPKISMKLLAQYSKWLSAGRLTLIENSACGGDTGTTDHLLSFWAGKLAAQSDPSTTRFFVTSDNYALQSVVDQMRIDGFEVKTSWPDTESIQCSDEMVYAVLHLMSQMDKSARPRSTDSLTRACRQVLPPYVSIANVMDRLESMGYVTRVAGKLHYDLPIFVDKQPSAAPVSTPMPKQPQKQLYSNGARGRTAHRNRPRRRRHSTSTETKSMSTI